MIDETDPGPSRGLRALLVAVVVLPVVTAVWRALRTDWFPIGDSALLYIRARDVLSTHHPLLGSWTSASLSVGENMNNPGPMYQDLLLPATQLFGFSSAAAIGVGLVNALTIVGVSSAARSIGGWAMQRWMLLACAVLAWVMGSELLIDIWQAHALLLPFLLLLVLAIGLAVGRWHLLPWSAGVATLLIQTHISYVYALGVVAATATATFLLTHRRLEWRRWRTVLSAKPVLVTVVVLALLWLQPLWEQVLGEGKGNLSRLSANASGGDVRLGAGPGVRLAAEILGRGPWSLRDGFSSLIPPIGPTERADGTVVVAVEGVIGAPAASLVLLLLVAVLGGLGWVAHRRGRQVPAAACWLTAGAVAGAPLCLALVTVGSAGLPQHHLRWLWTVGVLLNVVLAWALVDLVLARRSRGRRLSALAPVVLTVALALLSVPYLAQRQGPVDSYEVMPALRRVFRDLDRLEPLEPVVYDMRRVRVYEPYSSAVMMRLQELGIDFRSDVEVMVRQLGEGRRPDGTESTTVFQLEGAAALTYDGPACLISAASALDEDDERRVEATIDQIAGRLTDGSLRIRTEGLSGPDQEVAAAVTGDPERARRAVIDGTVERWFDDGALIGDDPDGALRTDLADVARRVRSTFAVYAETTSTCPA